MCAREGVSRHLMCVQLQIPMREGLPAWVCVDEVCVWI